MWIWNSWWWWFWSDKPILLRWMSVFEMSGCWFLGWVGLSFHALTVGLLFSTFKPFPTIQAKTYRNPGKRTMVSCRFSHKPIHWSSFYWTISLFSLVKSPSFPMGMDHHRCHVTRQVLSSQMENFHQVMSEGQPGCAFGLKVMGKSGNDRYFQWLVKWNMYNIHVLLLLFSNTHCPMIFPVIDW